MDERKAFFSHERRLGGLISQLRIEPRDEAGASLTARSFSLGNVLSPLLDGAFEEEFFHWVDKNANDMTWVSWVSQRWQPADEGGTPNPSGRDGL
jgi:hypothetical protein